MPNRTLTSQFISACRQSKLLLEDIRLTLFFNKKPDILYTSQNKSFVDFDKTTVPVIMCVWKRIEKLEDTIQQLVDQKNCKTALYLWNNHKANSKVIDKIIDTHTELSIQVHHSKRNIGSFARFYIARDLAKDFPHVVIIDDDEYFGSTTLSTFVNEFRPRTIHAFWSFRLKNSRNYWERNALKPGQSAKYCGLGGSIIDATIFLDDAVFKCPKRFWFMDDFWLSYYADHVKKWGLYKSGAKIEFWPDEHDMSKKMQYRKNRFLRYLVNRKHWDISL